MVIISRPNVPLIPELITVHLGAPDEEAENITLSFPDYIKNVASIINYPTWPESAIRANIYSIITFTLNRLFNNTYRDQGYKFDITNSEFDQPFELEREIPANISFIIDQIFTSYLIRRGEQAPAYTPYCDGVSKECEGLSQWGAVSLANMGYNPYGIIRYYFGDDIDIVTDIPVDANFEPFPLYPLKLGAFGQDVYTLQKELNRIGENYTTIPKIELDDAGIFGAETDAAVKEFQRIFNLIQDGIIGSATWYKIKYIYNDVKGLGELISEDFPEEIESRVGWKEGDSGIWIKLLQYYLRVMGCYYPDIPIIDITGYFGPDTTETVKALQKKYNIDVDGIVGIQTWYNLEKDYKSIVNNIPEGCLENKTLYPGYLLSKGMADQNVTLIQTYLQKISEFYPNIPRVDITGVFDDQTEAAVRAFEKEFEQSQGTGLVGPITWSEIARVYENLPQEE
ncbi:peptidoglycan-binding domain-containing protein [Anaerovorax odorimutans]|uniref:peptidoglycan-binding domain-containing protein n=1 Tax=Anaerovorax odorimutans TaxID=109327 RepID=UPI0004198A65|nr:peptidoglycan-binding protein [Anaerovorax odorimutans]